MKISQSQFNRVTERQTLSLRSLQRAGVSQDVTTAFERADRNRDGFIDNAKERKKLFKNLNKLEKRSGADRDKRHLNGAASAQTRSVWNLLVDNAINAEAPPPPGTHIGHVSGPTVLQYDPRVGPLLDKMMSAAGSGDQEDVDIVKAELSKLPYDVLEQFHKKGGRVRVCRGAVTEYMTELKGERPRGWPEGKTWDTVQGTYKDSTKEVVIATQELEMSFGGGSMRVLGMDHGSHNIVMHEFAHGFDRLVFRDKSAYRDFAEAYRQDAGAIDSPYLTQPGLSGREEAFAECFALHYNGSSQLDDMPEIQAFFNEHFPHVER